MLGKILGPKYDKKVVRQRIEYAVYKDEGEGAGDFKDLDEDESWKSGGDTGMIFSYLMASGFSVVYLIAEYSNQRRKRKLEELNK